MSPVRQNLTRDMLPPALPKPDRLPPMLFLAALFHAIVILGVTFEAELAGLSQPATLEVTIVAETNQHIARRDTADYLAQANQEGSGNTSEQVRPGAKPRTEAALPFPQEMIGDVPLDYAPGQEDPQTLLVSRGVSEQKDFAPPEPTTRRAESTARIHATPESDSLTLPLPLDDEANLLIHDDDPRRKVISADTEESRIAAYLDRWKRKVERVGTLHFPERARTDSFEGNPVLEVAIDAEGELTDIIVRRSSGHRMLDQAALNILRHAAPFDPFPDNLRSDYDELRFAYQWQFRRDGDTARIATR